MPADPADQAVADKLASALTLVVGTTIFRGAPVPPGPGVPHQAIFCMLRPGRPPLPYLGGASAADLWYPRVQVFVRGNVDALSATQTLARQVLAALHKATLTSYAGCVALQSEPIYAGLDDTEHPLFSVNVELWLVE